MADGLRAERDRSDVTKGASAMCQHCESEPKVTAFPLESAFDPLRTLADGSNLAPMYKLPAVLLVLICTAFTLWWMNIGKFNGSERNLFVRLEAVLAQVPPSPSKIATEFGLPRECGAKSCFFKASKLAEANSGGGNLRPSDDGLVFVLEELSGQCIRTERAADRFGLSNVKQVCDHGGCWYREVQHDWGILSFGLEKPDSACVSSVVINSLPEQRQSH